MEIGWVGVNPPSSKPESGFPEDNWAGGSLEAAKARHIINIPVNVPIEKTTIRLK